MVSQPSRQDEIKLELLGLRPHSSQVTPSERDVVRHEMLQRRRRYLDLQRPTLPESRRAGSRNWRRPTVTALLLVFVTGGLLGSALLGSASARQNRQNRVYALQLLGRSFDYFCEDLRVLNLNAAEAEALLPNASVLGLSKNDWQHLYASSRAARCLLTARMGQPALAAEQFLQARQYLDSVSNLADSSETRIAFDLCMGKSALSIMETFTDLGQSEKAQPLFVDAIESLENALLGLSEHAFLTPDESLVLSAGLNIDLARIRMKVPAPDYLGMTVENSAQLQNASMATAQRQLDSAMEHDTKWWIQNLRLLSHQAILNAREYNRRVLSDTEIENILSEHDRTLELLEATLGSLPSQLDNGLRYQLAIYTGNTADTLGYALAENQLETFGNRMVSLRSQAIATLSQIPESSRTSLHYVNIRINCARRMNLNARLAVSVADSPSIRRQILADAATLQTFLGDLLGPQAVQLGRQNRALAATVLNYPTPQIDAYRRSAPESIRQRDQTLIDAMGELLQSQVP